jgi:hypothetical protein
VALTTEQKQLVGLAARVPASDIPTAKRVLEALIGDPFWRALQAAPYDNEPVTPDDEAALAEAEAEFERGEITPHEEILNEFKVK